MTIKDTFGDIIKSIFCRDNIKIIEAVSESLFSSISFQTQIKHETFKYLDSLAKAKTKSLSIHNIFNSFHLKIRKEKHLDAKILLNKNDPYRKSKLKSYSAFESQDKCQQFFLVLDQLDQVSSYEKAIQFITLLKEKMPKNSSQEFASFVSSIDSVIQPITNLITTTKENLEKNVLLHAESHVKMQLNNLFTQGSYKTMLEDAQHFLILKRKLDYSLREFQEAHHNSGDSLYVSNEQSMMKITMNKSITTEHPGDQSRPPAYFNNKITSTLQGDDLVTEARNARKRFAEKYKMDSAYLETLTEISPEEFKFVLLKFGFSEAYKNLVAEGEEISSSYLSERLSELSPSDTNRYFTLS